MQEVLGTRMPRYSKPTFLPIKSVKLQWPLWCARCHPGSGQPSRNSSAFQGMGTEWLSWPGTEVWCMFVLDDIEKTKEILPTGASTAQYHFAYKANVTVKRTVLIPAVVETQTLLLSMQLGTWSLTRKATTPNAFQSCVSHHRSLLQGLMCSAEQWVDIYSLGLSC